jgi:outer membrane protein assembly factor BamB/predicted Ser/Thr protein kinase
LFSRGRDSPGKARDARRDSNSSEALLEKQIGKYTLVKEIGKGGMGVVYLAHDAESGRQVALKILPSELTRNPQYVERFRREAKAVSQLDHPHIIKVYEIGEQQGLHFFAMEYLSGPTLGAALKRNGRLPVPKAVQITIDIADALDLAHSHGIIHRDVKPDNILSDESGIFKIMDFGIARIEEGTRLTVTGSIMGTPEYMSPEQASGVTADRRTDIYSLGVVLYELVTGRLPFKGENAMEILQMHLTRAPESPKLINPEIPGNLANVIQKMLEKQAANRFDSFRHVINALGQAIPQNMRSTLEAPTREIAVGTARAPAREHERSGPRVRERIIIETPATIKTALAASIILNFALFGYLLLRPGGFPAKKSAARPVFAIGGQMFAPPALSDDTLFLGTEDGTLYACDLQTGERKWTFKAGDKLTASPVVDRNRVYIGSWDHYIYALDSKDGGRVIWKVDTGGCVFATPVLQDGTLYACTREGNVFAIDTETGNERWHDASGGTTKLSPTLKDGLLFVPFTDGGLTAYRVSDGKRIANLPAGKVKTSAAVTDGKLFFVTFNDAIGSDELRIVEYEAEQQQLRWGRSRGIALLPPQRGR